MNRKSLFKNSRYLLLVLPLFLLIVFFEIIPLFGILIKGFLKENTHNFSFENFVNIFTSEYYMMSIKNSLYVALLSAFIGIILAYICSHAIYKARKSLWAKRFVDVLNITSNFQGIQLAFAFIIILGNSGTFVLLGKKFGINFLLNFDLYTSFGIMLTYIFFQIPLGSLLLYPSFKLVKDEYMEAASLMNAAGAKFWRYIGIPILLPNILGTFSVLFANALAAYATPYALMGNNYALLPIKISTMFTGDIVQQKELGSALSAVMIGLIVLVTVICNKAITYEIEGEDADEN